MLAKLLSDWTAQSGPKNPSASPQLQGMAEKRSLWPLSNWCPAGTEVLKQPVSKLLAARVEKGVHHAQRVRADTATKVQKVKPVQALLIRHRSEELHRDRLYGKSNGGRQRDTWFISNRSDCCLFWFDCKCYNVTQFLAVDLNKQRCVHGFQF